MSLISEQELIDLINEVGQTLNLELPGSVNQSVNYELGIPAKAQPIIKPVVGYIFQPSRYQEMAVAGGNTQEGTLQACISASNLDKDEFKPGARLANGIVKYAVQYLYSITHQGKTLAHMIALTVIAR